MSQEKPPVEISAEELEYIRELCHNAVDELQELAGSATVEPPENAASLLNLLLLADNIRVQADIGNYTLVFEPRAEYAEETGTRQFHLGYPSIIEKRAHLRSHRVSETGDEIKLRENGQRLQHTHIENISETGLELVSDSPLPEMTPGETVLSLRLKFPDSNWAACKAQVVRLNREETPPRLALRFVKIPRRTHNLLRSYIFHHSPELGNTPGN